VIALAGVQEVVELLGVSRQRVHQLRTTPGFPAPLAELAAGAIWDRDAIAHWSDQVRTKTEGVEVRIPPRDSYRLTDDPWDADVVNLLLATSEGRSWGRGELMECMREQPNRVSRQPRRVEEAKRLAARHGIDRHADTGGRTIHFFRTDGDCPWSYPASASERRDWLQR